MKNQLTKNFEKIRNILKNTQGVTLSKNFFKNLFLVSISKAPRIKWLVYEVTNACNSRCRHCQIWQNKPSPGMLKAYELERILKDRFFNNLKVVLLTGGEPVLREDIKEIIYAIHKARPQVRMTLSTNGLLAEKVLEVFQYALDNDISLALGVSLDALGEKHDLIRGVAGNFQKIDFLLREAIKLKEKYKNKKDDVSVGIGFTLSNLTADYLKDVMNYARGLNLKFLIQLYEEFSFYHNISREDENLIENYTTSDNRRLIEEIEKLPPAFHHEILLYALRHRLKYRCDALRTFFVLRANADVAPCLCYYQEKIGNLKMQSPCEIFNSKEARLAQRLVKNCKGCSNGWATDWSYEEWAPYFWKIIFSLYLKKFLNKFKKNKCQSY